MRTLISSLESDSKRSTLESSSTSSSSRIVGCFSLICANPNPSSAPIPILSAFRASLSAKLLSASRWAHLPGGHTFGTHELRRTPLSGSSQNSTSTHSGENRTDDLRPIQDRRLAKPRWGNNGRNSLLSQGCRTSARGARPERIRGVHTHQAVPVQRKARRPRPHLRQADAGANRRAVGRDERHDGLPGNAYHLDPVPDGKAQRRA